MKKVSSQQIERLYEFTRQHYVEYYDVQTELVDHLANAIEAHWQTNPNADFEEVLQKEFRKFGVFGFGDVVQEKIKQMEKKYNALFFKKRKTFFTPPKLALTLCFGLSIFLFFSAFNHKILPFFVLLVLSQLLNIFYYYDTRKVFKPVSPHKWLFKTVLKNNKNGRAVFFTSLNMWWLFFVLCYHTETAFF